MELGHEVGLHYDTVAYAARAENSFFEVLHNEARFLSGLAGQSVRSIAMHNPNLSGGDPFRGDKAFINAYDDRFTKHIAYFSDSSGAWRSAAIQSFMSGNFPAQLQLLIHPLFWDECAGNRWQRMAKFTENRLKQIEDDLRRVAANWANRPHVQEHDRRVGQSPPL